MILWGDSIAAVRSLSLLFGDLTVVLVIAYAMAANERHNLIGGMVRRPDADDVHYSQETRMYALMEY